MDLQEMVNNKLKADRADSMKTSEQLTLGELILLLERVDGEHTVRFDYGYFYPTCLSSWRGVYSEIAIEYSKDGEYPDVQWFLKELKSALGKTFEGYKGGDFVMGKTTPLWVSNYGESNNTAVIGIQVLGWGVVVINTKYIECY